MDLVTDFYFDTQKQRTFLYFKTGGVDKNYSDFGVSYRTCREKPSEIEEKIEAKLIKLNRLLKRIK